MTSWFCHNMIQPLWIPDLGARHASDLLLVAAPLRIILNTTSAVVFNAPMVAYLFFWMAGSVTTVARRAETAAP